MGILLEVSMKSSNTPLAAIVNHGDNRDGVEVRALVFGFGFSSHQKFRKTPRDKDLEELLKD